MGSWFRKRVDWRFQADVADHSTMVASLEFHYSYRSVPESAFLVSLPISTQGVFLPNLEAFLPMWVVRSIYYQI